MNFQTSLILLGAVMIPFTAQAKEPERLTPDELAAIRKSAVISDEVLKAAAETRQQIEETRVASNEANSNVRSFLAQAALTTISVEDTPAPEAETPEKPTAPVVAPNKPLEVTPGPKDSIITADEGMYLDAEAGLLVYLKNVRLTSPEFELSGANQLQVFLEKKAPKEKLPQKDVTDPKPDPAPVEKKDDKKEAGTGLFGAAGGFGDPKKITASGAVKITKKAEGDKPPVVASAAFFDYNVKTKEIIIHGGYPWVQQGTTFLRSSVENGSLRIQEDGSFTTGRERWDAGGQFNDPAAKPANKPAKP